MSNIYVPNLYMFKRIYKINITPEDEYSNIVNEETLEKIDTNKKNVEPPKLKDFKSKYKIVVNNLDEYEYVNYEKNIKNIKNIHNVEIPKLLDFKKKYQFIINEEAPIIKQPIINYDRVESPKLEAFKRKYKIDVEFVENKFLTNGNIERRVKINKVLGKKIDETIENRFITLFIIKLYKMIIGLT